MAAIENICDKLLTTNHRPSSSPSLKFKMAAATERSENVEESNMSACKKNRRKNAKPRSLRMQEEEFVPIKPEPTGFEPAHQAERIDSMTENMDENRNEIDDEKFERDEEMTSSHHDEISSLPTADTDSFVDCKNDYDDDDLSEEDDVAMATDDGYYGNEAYLDADDFPSPADQTAENDSDSDEVLPRDSVPIDLSVKKEPLPLATAPSNGSNVKSEDLKDYAESAMNELLRMYGLKESFDGRRLPHDFIKHQTMKSLFMSKKSPSTSQVQDNNGPTERSGLDIIGAPPALIPLNRVSSEASAAKSTTNADSIKRDVSSNCLADAPAGFSKHRGYQTERASTLESGVNGLLPDYAKYVKKFDSYEDCKSSMCQDMHYREHFHCMDCNFRVFVKKDEMIRHYKWHRKRDESLQHGFLRFSPVDDCQDGGRFEPCVHNQKQTHYHCIQSSCNKVYVSTSDVQMHSNYHRKASAIIQEGFQRFRATEDCGTLQCQFYNQRTTHFHCRRSTCNFTFKNKADMEKHKTYHQKDEILAKDGFKKFMKYEHCTFKSCRYSKQSNHIHCIRPGCMYVLHSTGQLYSHKRKHERREFEFGIKRLNEDSRSTDSPRLSHFSTPPVSSAHSATNVGYMYETNQSPSSSSPRDSPQPIRNESDLNSSLNLPITTFQQERTPLIGRAAANEDLGENAANEDNGEDVPMVDEFVGRHVPPIMEKPERDESWKKYLTRFTANDPCVSRCPQLYKDHYHCNIRNCNVLFRTKERVREHGRLHDQEDRITFLTYRTVCESDQCYIDGCTANGTKHYHCLWPDCTTVITSQSAALSRLQHFRYHEQQRHLVNTTNKTWRFTQQQLTNDGLIRRKRGRPPKFPKDEIPIVPKPEIEDDTNVSDYHYSMEQFISAENGVVRGFKLFKSGEACPDTYCPYHMARAHFHCIRPRCHHVSTNVEHELRLHAHDFHNYVHIMEGFEFFDRQVNCRRPNCQNSRANKHFHCVRPRCDYAFVRHSTMYQHDKKHSGDNEDANEGSNDGASASNLSWDDKSKTVKAAGTYYPLSTLPKSIVQSMPVHTSFVPDFKPETKSSLVSSLATSVSGSFVSPFMMPPLLSLPGLIPMVGSPFQLLGSPHGNSLLSSPLATSLASSLASSFAASSLATSNSNAITLQQASAAATALSGLAQQSSSSSKPPLPTPPPKPQAPPEVLDHWYSIRDKMHFKLNQNCGRPFCKLKKRDHYHCFDCNQAFSDPERLRAHVGRHGVKFEKPSKDESLDLSLNLNGEAFAAKLAASSRSQNSEDSRDSFTPNLEIDLEKSSDSLNSSLDRSGFEDRKRISEPMDDSLVVKHRRIATPRVNKDEPVPEGYVRYWAHEDCARRGCSYRQSTTHVHCLRETCMFGICSRPRIIQHTQRHARIDRIMGNEFVHFRANIQCHEEDCTYSEKSSHFHCKKCPFTAQDTIKVTAHRKYHSKNDFFVSQGFDKYTVSQNCLIKDCKYAMRNTHYHCLFPGCFASVIGQSQMAPHRLKHAGFQERFASSSTASTGSGIGPSTRFGSNSMVFPSMVERNSDIFPGTRESDDLPSNETHSNRSSPSNSGPTCPPQLTGTVFDTR